MDFSRRNFIKAALAIGAAPAALVALDDQSDVIESDEIWSSVEESPIRFIVDEGGTLSVPYEVGPSNRWEAYDLWPGEGLPDRDKLIELIDRSNPVYYEISWWKFCKFPDLEGLSVEDLGEDLKAYAEYLKYSDWVDELEDQNQAIRFVERLSPNHYDMLAAHMKAWADSDKFGPEEWEEFDNPAGGQDYVFRFFNMQDVAFAEALGVVVVEGDRPGSTYYAAELPISIDEANKRARIAGIPIRFELG